MKNFVIIFVLILIIFFFYKSANNSTVNNTLNNADSSFVCPTPEEFWQNYINMRDSSEKFSDYAKSGFVLQIITAIAIFIIVPIFYPF